VNLEILIAERLHHEAMDRSFADLSGPVDIERAQGDGGHAELAMVGVDEMLAGQFAHGVDPARLAHGADGRHLRLVRAKRIRAEDLAGGEVDEAVETRQPARGVEHVRRADQIHPHGGGGALDDRVDAGDRGEVHDHVGLGVGHRRGKRRGVEHVAAHHGEARMRRPCALRERVAAEVVEGDDAIGVDEASDERRADEPRAAGQKDGFPFQHQ